MGVFSVSGVDQGLRDIFFCAFSLFMFFGLPYVVWAGRGHNNNNSHIQHADCGSNAVSLTMVTALGNCLWQTEK
jgi:hypothetical protein